MDGLLIAPATSLSRRARKTPANAMTAGSQPSSGCITTAFAQPATGSTGGGSSGRRAVSAESSDLITDLDKALELIEQRNKALKQLFKNLGAAESTCRCGATIYFLAHKNNTVAPYDADGETHFATCPHAKKFRKTK
jgi:hypothetical protein